MYVRLSLRNATIEAFENGSGPIFYLTYLLKRKTRTIARMNRRKTIKACLKLTLVWFLRRVCIMLVKLNPVECVVVELHYFKIYNGNE